MYLAKPNPNQLFSRKLICNFSDGFLSYSIYKWNRIVFCRSIGSLVLNSWVGSYSSTSQWSFFLFKAWLIFSPSSASPSPPLPPQKKGTKTNHQQCLCNSCTCSVLCFSCEVSEVDWFHSNFTGVEVLNWIPTDFVEIDSWIEKRLYHDSSWEKQ